MKRILIFNDSLGFGGTERLLVNILTDLSKKSYDITLLLPLPDDNNILLNQIPENITVKYIYCTPLSRSKKIAHENIRAFFPSIYLKLTGINLNPYDLIVCFKDSIFSNIFTRAKQTKILWIHNLPTKYEYKINSIKEYIPVKLLSARINKLIRSYRKYNHIICVSEAVKIRFLEVFNNNKTFPDQSLHVIHNAIDFEKIKKSASALQIDKKNDLHFIMATRFSPEKRLDRVINAAKQLSDEGHKFYISILGDGETFEHTKDLIRIYRLQDKIRLKGYIENPYPEIKAADWLICSSEKESFSLVLLESIYLGTPVITTDCGGPTEISANGKYALLTENSTEGIYHAMKKALINPDLGENYTIHADECLKRFDYKEWLKKANEIFELN